jgi:predicted CXXCH cytochrome family protein
MKVSLFTAGLMVVLAMTTSGVAPLQANSIVDSLHNLSISGPGVVKATSQAEICIFCHTPHNARSDLQYLWNRQDPASAYTPYYSSTLRATVGQPTGTSRLCLSCHDGTIAPGAVLSQATVMPFTASLSGRSSNLGTYLADDHPISFDYNAAALMPDSQLAVATSLPSTVRLDANGQMQCTACHNPHNDQYGKFLVMSNLQSGLCVGCHKKTNWTSGSHSLATKTWSGIAPDPWPTSSYTTVADNACGNCHRPHNASGPQRLLNYSVEETTCLVCHNGNVALKNIAVDLEKPYRHPVASFSGVHDAAENYAGAVSKHVECVDCHNPHQANSSLSAAPLVPGRLQGVPAVSTANIYLATATYEYEVCFKCHGSLINNVMPTTSYPRVTTITDNRIKFATTNPSFHPVMGPLNKISDNMLIAPWVKGSIIYCTDCHGSDSSGIRGSHGSIYKHILLRKFETSEVPATTYTSDDYALCFGCHNVNTLFGTNTKFKQHKTHISTHAQKDRCVYCHDPHGNPYNLGMINFDLRVVSQNAGQPIQYKPPVINKTSCVLVCHGVPHG